MTPEEKKAFLQKMSDKAFSDFQGKLQGHFQDTGRPMANPGEALDAYTGAPVRTAIGEMQEGNFGPEMLKKVWKQMGSDPTKAPTGENIVRKAGVENDTLASVLGAGVDMAADASGVFGMAQKGITPMAGKLFKVGDISFPANNTAEALKIKHTLEQSGKVKPNRALQELSDAVRPAFPQLEKITKK